MVKILIDSGSDLSKAEADKLGVTLLSMQISIDENIYYSGVNLDNKTFYELLKICKEFPKTSLLSPHMYLKHFEEAKKNNDELIVLTLSSGLSGTYNSAKLALSMVNYDKIYIIDTLSASIGQRLLLDECLRLISLNKEVVEIINIIENLKTKIKSIALVDTLEYLHKGGRISKTQAFIGDTLNIKPIISFTKQGTLEVISKSLGKKRGKSIIIKNIEKSNIDTNYPVYYMYSVDINKAIELKDEIEKKLNKNYLNIFHEVGPTIGSHVGPNIIGLVYIEKS